MNAVDYTMIGKQLEAVQAGLRKARAEVAALNGRFDGLEARVVTLERQVAAAREDIAEIGFRVDDFKSYVEIRFDRVNDRFDALEALLREALAR